ncbi:MAG: hypothetical protein NC251_10465 [Lachnoclostridium sp.]|nr:hypothetical protein [Lachnospira sp.]MCM1248841.1 hypothetical protein [Lachnoclostridium sp.]MCM1535306.1 hypothetical protein [Clostridium sp.]
MANYSREDMEKQGNTAVGLGAAALIGLGGLLVKALNDNKQQSMINNNNNRINAQIADIDSQTNDYKSRFLGSIFYADKISALESKRAELKKQIR